LFKAKSEDFYSINIAVTFVLELHTSVPPVPPECLYSCSCRAYRTSQRCIIYICSQKQGDQKKSAWFVQVRSDTNDQV